MKCRGARGGPFEPFSPRLKETVSSNICWRIWAELPSIGAPLWNKGKAKWTRWPIFSLSSRCSFLPPNPSACSFSSDCGFFLVGGWRWDPEAQNRRVQRKPRLIPAHVWSACKEKMIAFKLLQFYEASQDFSNFSAVVKLQRRPFHSSTLQQ